ncbi:MAG: excisionase family DNA-binding protein [Geodermatophilaceae bacterium]|nr:excisionase family DNA-binding protein [Geodermatophilaceae bacterium]
MSVRFAPTSLHRRLASITSAAEAAACSTKTIRRLISRGDLTGYRMGSRLVRVDLNELDALMTPIPTARSGSAA